MEIFPYALFPRFQLTMTYLPFIGSVVSFSKSCDSTPPNPFLLRQPLRCLKNIKWHCIGFFDVLWHDMAKCIFRRLDKQCYQCPINLIAHNITAVFSIIAWHFIRNQHLVYIDRKYISYLSLSIKVFGCNLFLTKFRQLLLIHI